MIDSPLTEVPVESETTRISNPPIPVTEQAEVKKVSLALLTLEPVTDPALSVVEMELVVGPVVDAVLLRSDVVMEDDPPGFGDRVDETGSLLRAQ